MSFNINNFGRSLGKSPFGGRGYGRAPQGDNENVQAQVLELAETLANIFSEEYSPEEIVNLYIREIREAGFKFLGRGQNRLAFMYEGSSWVYKVPFREIGIRDNKVERYISSFVTTQPKVYEEIGKHIPIVTNFALPDGWQDFMICAEYIANLKADANSGFEIGSAKDEAIYVCVDNYQYVSEVLRKLNKYFHMNDVHLVIGAENFGVKGNDIAVRDIGYFVPRIGELENVTASYHNKEVQMLYWTLDNVPLNEHERKDVDARIEKLRHYAESWAPATPEGEIYNVESKDDLYDAADCIQALLQVLESEYID